MQTDQCSVPGNAEVIRCLEHFLVEAKKGLIGHLVVVACQAIPQNASGGIVGDILLEELARNAAHSAIGRLNASLENRTLPPRDPALGADYVCYNVPSSPLSFDFLVWLIDAEMNRVRKGAPAPLKIAFWFGRDGKSGLDSPSRQQMFEKVARPAVALLGAVEDERALGGNYRMHFTAERIVDGARAGETVPKFRASAELLREVDRQFGAGFVTITLREYSQWPHRNSNIAAWLRFADWLKERRRRVVIVRDTEKALEPLPGYVSFPQASLDLGWRMALYEHAAANLFVSNGPVMLAHFSDRPWLMFIEPKPDGHPYYPSTPKFLREHYRIEVGGQYPWSRPDQRWIWAKDDFETIVAAWEALGV